MRIIKGSTPRLKLTIPLQGLTPSSVIISVKSGVVVSKTITTIPEDEIYYAGLTQQDTLSLATGMGTIEAQINFANSNVAKTFQVPVEVLESAYTSTVGGGTVPGVIDGDAEILNVGTIDIGKDGVGIESIEFNRTDPQGNNVYDVNLTDETSYEITAPKGAKGDKGDAGALGSVTASVDANVGTPSVVVTYNGTNADFAFHNLKGEPQYAVVYNEQQNLTAEQKAQARTNIDAYTKPNGGIPKADLVSSVQTSLDKADTALQEHQSLSAYRTASAQDVIDNAIKNDVDAIEEKIPSQATSTNKLADKDFVNSSIATNTANYISNNGQPFTSVAQLEAYTGTVTNNDYAFVTGTDEQGNTYFDRYKATVSGATVTWAKEYRLNNSSFTASQWSAISSGITSSLVADIGSNTSARHTHSNKALLDTYTQAEANLSDAVSKKHSHNNKSVLDAITQSLIDTWNTVTGKYSKPSGGIPKSDLASDVQTSLGKADTSATDIATINSKIPSEASSSNQLADKEWADTYDTTVSGTDYTVSVPSVAQRYSELGMVGGKTVVWNQLVNATGTQTTSGVTRTYSNGRLILNGTATVNNAFYLAIPSLKQGDKLFLSVPTNGSDSTYRVGLSVFNATFKTQGNVIYTVPQDAPSGISYVVDFFNGATFTDESFVPMLINLTKMFGSGNEPSQLTDEKIVFIKAYASAHPEYNAGSLVSASVNNVKSVGANVWDEETMNGYYSTSDGTFNSNSNYVCNKNQTKVSPSTTYHFRCNTFTHPADSVTILYYGIGGNYISYATQSAVDLDFTTPSNCGYVNFYMTDYYGATYKSDIQICLNTYAEKTTYHPYVAHNYPIPASVQALEGYGWSAGSVYNYINFAEKKFHKRVGSVDLGSLNWASAGAHGLAFKSEDLDPEGMSGGSVVQKIVCGRYTSDATDNVYNETTNKSIGVNGNNVWVYDTTYTDATAFKTAMNGVMLYYELATEVVTDISSLITDYSLIPIEQGGTVTFENSAMLSVPNTMTYITKDMLAEALDKIHGHETNPYAHDKSRSIITKASWDNFATAMANVGFTITATWNDTTKAYDFTVTQ